MKKLSYFTVILFVTMNWLQFLGGNMHAMKLKFKNLTLMESQRYKHGDKNQLSQQLHIRATIFFQ